ncbi:alpha/beta fold hydrolase [Azospirillum doebereinerae]|uniref:alpha/beta fold hydrolase n=1 Tax=Azospirillum doebereinerae TaxID=92933 RepID=UPI001EE5A9B0|nr:alpha/beta hydrolase [Azospirillum doebereinerae]MCG5243706.1 alpha/beta hydrolase [Azospirillum doebereinerae]
MNTTDLSTKHTIKVYGSGDRTLVFSHGFGLDQTSWHGIAMRLARTHRVVLFDLVGFTGASSEHYDHHKYRDLESYADDLLNVLGHARVRRCTFIGHSVSGMIGLLASIQEPTLFEKLILVGASPRYRNGEGYNGGFEEQDLNDLFDSMSENYVLWTQNFAPAAVSKPTGHPAVRKFAEGLLAMRPDVALSIALMIFSSDCRDRLAQVSVPCTLIQSRNDIAVPLSVAEYLTAMIPDSELMVIDADGHMPQLSAPDILYDAIQRALTA